MQAMKVNLKYLWGTLVLVFVFLTAIDRLIPVISYYLHAGAAPGGVVRGGLIALCLAGGITARLKLSRLDFYMASLLILFLGYTIAVYSFSDVYGKWFSYYSSFTSYYFYFFMFFLVRLTGIKVSEYGTSWIATLACLGLGLMAIMQWVLNDPLVNLDALRGDMELSFNEIYFYGHVRGFSLFSSGLASGLFCNLGFAVCFSFFISSNRSIIKRTFWAFCTLFFIGVAYVSLTRVVYVQALIILLYVTILWKFPKVRPHYYIFSLFSLSAGFLMAVGLPLLSDSSSGVGSSESLQIRIGTWVKYLTEMYYSNISQIMFGKQGVQAAVLPPAESIIFDNTFLAVFYQIGLIGVFIWVLVYMACVRYSFRISESLKWSPFSIAIYSYFCTWLFIGMFNTRPGAGCLALTLLCVVWNDVRYKSVIPKYS